MVYGVEILEKVIIVFILLEVLKGCYRAIVIIFLDCLLFIYLENFKYFLFWLLGYLGVLIFGREDWGLINVELNYV